MRKNLYIILCIVITQALHAEFRKGYIITKEFDTIPGLLDNKNFYNNSLSVDFKKEQSEVPQTFYPSDIMAYRFLDGKYYVAKTLDGRILFLEYLIDGQLDVFFLQDEELNFHYYVSKDTLPLRELKYYNEIRTIDGNDVMYEATPYIPLLRYYTSDCANLEGEFKLLRVPDHQDLIHFAEKYHNHVCSGTSCIIYEKDAHMKFKLEASVGSVLFHPSLYFHTLQLVTGFNLLMQSPSLSERLYLGLGCKIGEELQFPVSINYISSKTVGPYFGAECYLRRPLGEMPFRATYKAGVKYQMKNFSIMGGVNVYNYYYLLYMGFSPQLSIAYDL